MNNQYDCGCDGGSFVPVTGNWDFNMDGYCQRQRQNRCNICADARQENTCQEKQRCAQHASRSEKNACTGRVDCACETCVTRQRNTCTGHADCACEACARRRQTACESCARQKNKADNLGVGMMWAKVQELDTIYDCDHALQAGTLYPELHMPLNGYRPCNETCADHAQKASFMLWELRLYLNTHPNDKEALALFRQLAEKTCDTYATAFLPEACGRWAWVDDPWPWEFDCQCRK